MYSTRSDVQYFLKGVESFIQAAIAYATCNPKDGYMCCPCRDCKNDKLHGPAVVRTHLITRGFIEDYKVWTKHGESMEDDQGGDERVTALDGTPALDVNAEEVVNDVFRDTLADDAVEDDISRMLHDAEPGILCPRQLEKLRNMRKDAKTLLYPGCEVSKLEADLMLLALKSAHGLSDKCFGDVLRVLKKLLPCPNELQRRQMRPST